MTGMSNKEAAERILALKRVIQEKDLSAPLMLPALERAVKVLSQMPDMRPYSLAEVRSFKGRVIVVMEYNYSKVSVYLALTIKEIAHKAVFFKGDEFGYPLSEYGARFRLWPYISLERLIPDWPWEESP